MTAPLITGLVRPIKAPNLQLASDIYSRQMEDDANNILRLYFRTLDNAVSELLIDVDYLNVNSQGEKLYKFYNCGGF